jgi:hypothetical protein
MKDDDEFVFVDNPSQQASSQSEKKETVAPAPIDGAIVSSKNTENEDDEKFTFLTPTAPQEIDLTTNPNAVGAGVGLAASELLRSQMREGIPYSKEMKAAKELQLEEGKESVKSAIEAAKRMLPEDFAAHQERGQPVAGSARCTESFA